MNKLQFLVVTIGLFLCTTLTACTAPHTQAASDPAATDTPQASIPNPASVYCEQNGNKLEIYTAADGSQNGICVFPDGSTCDEWAYFRGGCGPAAQKSPTPAKSDKATPKASNDGTEENASGGYMPPGTSEEMADWWGVIKSTPPGAQYDDYFERQDLGGIIYFGIDSMDPAVKAQIEALRDSGKIVHLYGTLLSNVPDYNSSQIQVERIEVEKQTGAKANFEVKQIIPLKDGYILAGSLAVDMASELTVSQAYGYLDDVTILDANKAALIPSMAPGDFVFEGSALPNNQFNWAMQITATNIAWPLTITVNSVPAYTEPYAPSSFQVNVGEDPQPGQEWTINKDVPLGPKMVHVDSIKRMKMGNGFNGYGFTFTYDPTIHFSFEIEGGDPNGGGGEGGSKSGEPFTLGRSYRGRVPTGVLTVILSGEGVEIIEGPWQVIVAEPVLLSQ
jgi:putative hemolysin